MQDGRLQKRPATAHGHHDASLDPEVVRDMFVQAKTRYGGELAVGLLPGAGNLIVLDPDVKTDDRDGVRFADSLGIPNGWLVHTPSGGQHRYFTKPDPAARFSNAVPPTWVGFIDIRVDHGWVVAPGTVTQWGSWRAAEPWPAQGAPQAPLAVLGALTYTSGQSGPSGTPAGRLDGPGRDSVPAHTLRVLDWLAEHHGAHNPILITRDEDVNYVAVTRPGKRVGISATIGFADSGALYLYSSSWVIDGVTMGVSSFPLGRDSDTLGATTATVTATVQVAAGPFLFRGQLQALTMAQDIMANIPVARDGLDGTLWYYESGVWRRITQGRDILKRSIVERLGERYRPQHRMTTMDVVSAMAEELDPGRPDPRYINVQNGMLDWRARALVGHAPEFLSINQLPVEWRADARCPVFDAWISEVLPKDLTAEWLDELLGYLVLSGNPLQKAILLMGRGRNGKGTFIRVIQALLGEDNYSTVALQDLGVNRFRAADMYGKLANICGDLDASRLESTALFKMVTGGDTISAERKYSDAFSYTPIAVPLFSANAVFGTPDTSDGYMSRWLVVPFPYSFAGREDTGLTERLTARAELEGILCRAVRGIGRLMLRGKFESPDSVTDAKEQFARESDPIRAFLADCTVREPTARFTRAEVWPVYTLWSGDSGHTAMSKTKFYARLEEAGLQASRSGNAKLFYGARLLVRASYGNLVPVDGPE